MRHFIFSIIFLAGLLGLLSVPSETDAQRMMQPSPPAQMAPPLQLIPRDRMQSLFFAPQGFYPGSYMPSQMQAYPMQGPQMSSYGYPRSGYQMSSYPGGSSDPYGSPSDSYGGSQYPSNAQSPQAAVGVYDDLYQPSSMRIAAGTTVVWQNHGRHQHTVISDDGTWGSGELGAEASYEYTFSKPGLYHYYCKMHPRAMRGTIEVK